MQECLKDLIQILDWIGFNFSVILQVFNTKPMENRSIYAYSVQIKCK